MKREILFRVWDAVMSKYLNVNEVLSFNLDGTISNRRPHSVIEQYTGLKDKNGVKIFEGDILRTPDYNGTDKRTVIYEIDYDGAGFYPFNEPFDRKHLEVIGNIHDKEQK